MGLARRGDRARGEGEDRLPGSFSAGRGVLSEEAGVRACALGAIACALGVFTLHLGLVRPADAAVGVLISKRRALLESLRQVVE